MTTTLYKEMGNMRIERADELVTPCEQCHGAGMIYVGRPVYIGTRYYGDIEEMQPCPACRHTCQLCGGVGVVRYNMPANHPQFGKLFPCPKCDEGKRMEVAMQRAELSRAQLPDEYKKLTFRRWDKLPASLRAGKQIARHAAELFAQASQQNFYVRLSDAFARAGQPFTGEDSRRNSLVLQGDVGLGKTGLAAAMMNALVPLGAEVLYTRARDLIRDVQDTYSNDDRRTADVISTYQRVRILVIDEFNLQKGSEDRLDIMEEVVRARHGNSLPTVFTMNIDRDQLEKDWGIRTATVVRAMAHWFTLTGLPLRNEGEAIVEEA